MSAETTDDEDEENYVKYHPTFAVGEKGLCKLAGNGRACHSLSSASSLSLQSHVAGGRARATCEKVIPGLGALALGLVD